MTEMNSRPIIQRTVVRQTAEPNRPLAGMTWINPAGGQNGNNSETYAWNDDADVWELTRSTGPDTPLNAAAGATWTDTGNGTVKNYRAGAWQNVGVTDHANLSNVTASQHHTRPSAGTHLTEDGTGNFNVSQTFEGHTDVSLIASGSVSLASGATTAAASAYTISGRVFSLAHADPNTTNGNDSDRTSFGLTDAGFIANTGIGTVVETNGDGTHDLLVANDGGSSQTVFYAFWDIQP